MRQKQSQKVWLASLAAAGIFMSTACSREPQPIVEAIKPAQNSLEKAQQVQQTLEKSQGNLRESVKD